MFEVKGKRWTTYITIFILGELNYQGCKEVPETNISKLCTKSFMRMPCSIKQNTSSFKIFDYIIGYGKKGHIYYKGGSKPQYTMMSLQNLEVVFLNMTQSCAT